MYGMKMGGKAKETKSKSKAVPVTVMIAVGKPKGLPMRGGRTATNMMMKKSGKGK